MSDVAIHALADAAVIIAVAWSMAWVGVTIIKGLGK